MKIEITDEQINLIIIEELKTQYEYCDEYAVKLACKILLNFYGVEQDDNTN